MLTRRLATPTMTSAATRIAAPISVLVRREGTLRGGVLGGGAAVAVFSLIVSSPHVTDVAVAPDAAHGLVVRGLRHLDAVDQVAVAVEARGLGDPAVDLADLDVLGVVLGRELQRVPEAVVGLVDVLVDEVVVGRVAVVAGGGVGMAALAPGVVLLVHGVALRAGGRVAAEVGHPVGVAEGEHPQAHEGPDEHRERGVDQAGHPVAVPRPGEPRRASGPAHHGPFLEGGAAPAPSGRVLLLLPSSPWEKPESHRRRMWSG